MKIEDILAKEEGLNFDRKSINVKPKSLANIMVAMANADGGDIAIGITDEKREIEGIDKETIKVNDLLKVPFDLCNPTISTSFDKISCIDRNGNPNHVLLFHIQAGNDVYSNQQDESFIRVGDSTKKLSFDERIQLIYDKGKVRFEDMPVDRAEIEDIDLQSLDNYLHLIEYKKDAVSYLKNNKNYIIKRKDGTESLSVAAVLLFTKSPQIYLPSARVRFIKYSGKEEKVGAEMNVIKDVIFEGTLLQQIQKTTDYLQSQVDEHTYLGEDGIFITDPDYPKFVLQELVVNAVCHRDYGITGTEIQIKMFEDRLIVESPGSLPGPVRLNNMQSVHFSRNPKIATFLRDYHFVKEFGEGIDRMNREMKQLGKSEIIYHSNSFILSATALNNKTNNETVNETVNKTVNETVNLLITLIRKNPLGTYQYYAKQLGKDRSTIARYIKTLVQKGIIIRIGTDKKGKWIIKND